MLFTVPMHIIFTVPMHIMSLAVCCWYPCYVYSAFELHSVCISFFSVCHSGFLLLIYIFVWLIVLVLHNTRMYIDRLDSHVHCVLLMHVISLMVSRNLYAAANTYKFSVAIRPKVR